MNVAIFGQNQKEIEPLVIKSGLNVVAEKPELVLAYGGDGTLMLAEAAFPGVPKAPLRDSLICKKCSSLSNDQILARIKEGKFEIENLLKLEVIAGGKKLVGLNDIVIHNHNSRHALRYKVFVNGESLGHEVIGDGVVVATPFGSAAYFRSITDSFFEVGIGLAFNNSTEQADHMILKEDSVIELEVTRGPAAVYADNQAEEIIMAEGGKIAIRKSSEVAKIVKI